MAEQYLYKSKFLVLTGGDTMVLTSLALSMAVNTLVTGLDRAQDPQGVLGS